MKVSGLCCRRGERLLIDQLDFEVAAGEILLLRGPNGAGKTTLLLALAGVVRPEAGSIALTGGEADAGSMSDLHLLGHRAAVKPRLTVAENLRFWADMNGGERALIEPALVAAGLAHAEALEAGHLSAGQTRRLALARLLVAERPVWLLDEPTAALDSDGELLVGRLLDAHLLRGGLVVAATHHDLALRPPVRLRTLTLGVPA
ncbi:MAG: heme ABC exporter ATP-binding protein CcmA [Devosia sp.]|nr:heme ABC exporter ATP-binding protein CcmA [Devosia sp.]